MQPPPVLLDIWNSSKQIRSKLVVEVNTQQSRKPENTPANLILKKRLVANFARALDYQIGVRWLNVAAIGCKILQSR
jgi:hypothetical protein